VVVEPRPLAKSDLAQQAELLHLAVEYPDEGCSGAWEGPTVEADASGGQQHAILFCKGGRLGKFNG
jgi:hypothetical protein